MNWRQTVSTSPSASRPQTGKNVGAWVLQILLAAVFLAAAGAKFAGVPMLLAIRDRVMGQNDNPSQF